MSGLSPEEPEQCVTFCEGCPFANGIIEAPVDSADVWTAYGNVHDAEGRRSVTFSDGATNTKVAYIYAGRRGWFGSGDTRLAKDMVVGGINACDELVVVRGLLRTKRFCGAFYSPDGSKASRLIEIRNKRDR